MRAMDGMIAEILRSRGVLQRLLRRALSSGRKIHKVDLSSIAFKYPDTPPKELENFTIEAYLPGFDRRVGMVSAEYCIETRTCYVGAISVVNQYRRQGIAERLLSLALNVSNSETIVPVSIDNMSFWDHLYCRKKIPIRIGMTGGEFSAIKHRSYLIGQVYKP